MVKQQQESDQNAKLWKNWILLRRSQNSNLGFQLKKQGVTEKKSDQPHQFSYRPSYSSPPSIQEFYQAILNGIMKRNQLDLYKGKATYYQELQNCFKEFAKLLNFKSEILVEVFQSITKLNLSKQTEPKLVVNCANCSMYIYTTLHCKTCMNEFYCDKTCLKNHSYRHSQECQFSKKLCPRIMYPLQVEIHCGSDLCENLQIYCQHERRLSVLERSKIFLKGMFKVLVKNRWLKNNQYIVIEETQSIRIESRQKSLVEKQRVSQQRQGLSIDDIFQIYMKMAVVQELRMVFLNHGAILQDCIKELYSSHIHLALIYYFPV